MKTSHAILLLVISAPSLVACGKTSEWQENRETVTPESSTVHFTVASTKTVARVGARIPLEITLENPTDIDRAYEILDDGELEGIRPYAMDAEGNRHELDFFYNLNRGVRKRVVNLPAGALIEKKIECRLGKHHGKGNVTEWLPAGEYQLGIQLGDTWLTGPAPVTLPTNHITITIEDA